MDGIVTYVVRNAISAVWPVRLEDVLGYGELGRGEIDSLVSVLQFWAADIGYREALGSGPGSLGMCLECPHLSKWGNDWGGRARI